MVGQWWFSDSRSIGDEITLDRYSSKLQPKSEYNTVVAVYASGISMGGLQDPSPTIINVISYAFHQIL